MSDGVWKCEYCGYTVGISWGQANWECPRCQGDKDYVEKINAELEKIKREKMEKEVRERPLPETFWSNKDKTAKLVIDSVVSVCKHLDNESGKCGVVPPCDTSCNLKNCSVAKDAGLNGHGFKILKANCKELTGGVEEDECLLLIAKCDPQANDLFTNCKNVICRGDCDVVNDIRKTFPQER